MFSLLFHSDLFLPDEFRQKVIALEQKMRYYLISKHLQEHLDSQMDEDNSHRYFKNAVINRLNEMCSDDRQIIYPFEVEASKDFSFFGRHGWFITKYCIRFPFKQNEDLVIVVRPKWDRQKGDYDYFKFLIATAWINKKSDFHMTLDRDKYCTSIGYENAKNYKSRMFK